MTAPQVFPPVLPCGSLQYGYDPADATARTPFDAGPARVRQRYTSTPTTYKVRWVFSQPMLAIFEFWFRNYVSQGAAWFSIELLQGAGIIPVDARFIGPWSASLTETPQYFAVTASLEVRERPLIDQDLYDLLLAIGPDNFLSAEYLLDRIMNEYIPEDF